MPSPARPRTPRRAPAFAAVPDAIGAQDISGPYEVVAGWPKDLSTLPGHEKWTYGGARGIFAESPNRVYLLGGGELPNIQRPQTKLFPDVGPNVQFPSAGCRGATPTPRRRPAAAGRARTRRRGWSSGEARRRRIASSASTARWEHSLIVVDAQGNIIEEWTQWDKMFKRPHAVYVSPYDAEKHVWVVDDHTHAIYKFTNDGKQLVQTIGTPNVAGADGTHFNRPTFMAWLPDGSFYVSDGYNGTRVAKFDAQGKFLLDFGMRGEAGEGNAPGLHEQRARRRGRRRDAARVRQRSRQPPHPDLRRERQVPVRVEDCRQPVEPALRPDRRGSGRWRPSIATRTRC